MHAVMWAVERVAEGQRTRGESAYTTVKRGANSSVILLLHNLSTSPPCDYAQLAIMLSGRNLNCYVRIQEDIQSGLGHRSSHRLTRIGLLC